GRLTVLSWFLERASGLECKPTVKEETMKKRKRSEKLMGLVLLFAFINGVGFAQPSASQLADEITSKNNMYLSQIENIAITTDVLGFTSTTRYVKRVQSGINVLEPAAGDDGMVMYSGSMGKEL